MDMSYSVEGGQFAAVMRIIYDGSRYMRVIQVFKGEVGGKPVPVGTDYLFDMQKMMGYLHSPEKHQWLPQPFLTADPKEEFVWDWASGLPFTKSQPLGSKKIGQYTCKGYAYDAHGTTGQLWVDTSKNILVLQIENALGSTITYRLLNWSPSKVEPRNYKLPPPKH